MKIIKIILVLCLSSISLLSQSTEMFQTISKQWIKDYNNESSKEALSKYYLTEGGLFIENKMIQGASKIGSVLQELISITGKLSSFKSLGIHQLDESHYFEMGQYNSLESDTLLISIIGWNLKPDGWKKELEILYLSREFDDFDIDGIDMARDKWMKLSNEHAHEKLVSEVYTSDAIYFHGAKVSTGTEEITPRYSYMSRPSWSITLNSLQQIPISNNLVLEIGRYKSSGTGLYVLIWTRIKDDWQAIFDFNF